jgi:signal transduction histidine kinase
VEPVATPDTPPAAPVAAALQAVSDAVLGLAGELTLEPVLERLVHAARGVVGARYAALGIPDEEGRGFDRFITAGMSDALIAEIGPLPRTHGLLAAMLTDPSPYRTDDIAADPRFEWWPAAHPRMRSFLGVPLLFKGDIVGAFYLADKEGGFDQGDEDLMVVLAAHAAMVVEHARLYEASRERSITEERDRLARELHDALTQRLFGLNLTLEATVASVRTDPDGALTRLGQARDLVDSALAELRALIFELRPPALEEDGLGGALAKHADLLTRAHGLAVTVTATDHGGDGGQGRHGRLAPETERQLLRVAQEALSNVVRHAGARSVDVMVDVGEDTVTVVVEDDGAGFDPTARAISSRRLGLTSMRERVAALGGELEIDSAPGKGTRVRARVPRA